MTFLRYRLKQREKGRSIVHWLMSMGVKEKDARKIGSSGKGKLFISILLSLERDLPQRQVKNWTLLAHLPAGFTDFRAKQGYPCCQNQLIAAFSTNFHQRVKFVRIFSHSSRIFRSFFALAAVIWVSK